MYSSLYRDSKEDTDAHCHTGKKPWICKYVANTSIIYLEPPKWVFPATQPPAPQKPFKMQ
jgi:hypothetical protein